MIYLNKFSIKIWPLFGLFSHLIICPFLKLPMAKFCLLYFSGPGNPDSIELHYLFRLAITELLWDREIWICYLTTLSIADWKRKTFQQSLDSTASFGANPILFPTTQDVPIYFCCKICFFKLLNIFHIMKKRGG